MINRGRPPSAILTYQLAHSIAGFVSNRYTLKKIAKLEGMPRLHVLYYWTKKYEYFRDLLASVKACRKENLLEAKMAIILQRLKYL
jgi:hypothetical protein